MAFHAQRILVLSPFGFDPKIRIMLKVRNPSMKGIVIIRYGEGSTKHVAMTIPFVEGFRSFNTILRTCDHALHICAHSMYLEDLYSNEQSFVQDVHRINFLN